MTILTNKQRVLLKKWQRKELKRLNILEGSVRSGKTWISLLLWGIWVSTQPKEKEFLMVGKTMTSLKRNCLNLLQTLVGKSNFEYSLSKKEAKLFGRKIHLEGCNDVRAEDKIRGMTLQGAYIDEITLMNKEFFGMLLSRLSEKGAKLIGTTNPDAPTHWFNTDYLSRREELDMFVMKFLIDDNTHLDSEYVQQLKKEYVGVFYERFILGLWISAEGAIYRIFSENKDKYKIAITEELKKRFIKIVVGVDFGGNTSQHALVAAAITRQGDVVFLKSNRIKAGDTTPQDLSRLVREFVHYIDNNYGFVNNIYCDNVETVLINGIRVELYGRSVLNALKIKVIDRIRGMLALMGKNAFFINEVGCESLERALESALYDPKSITDERLDNGTSDIDTLDSAEYCIERFLNQLVKVVRYE